MKESRKILMLIVCLVLAIGAVTIVTLMDIDVFGIKLLSVVSIKERADSVGTVNLSFEKVQTEYEAKIAEKTVAEKEFENQKNKYAAISDETISLIKDVTKDQKYMIEYLWVVLGDYAEDNDLKLVVMEPGQSATFNVDSGTVALQEAKAENETTVTTPTGTAVSTDGTVKEGTESTVINPTTDGNTVKILLVGKYQDVADFVFDVENDKSLKFKLDNISMQYAGSNSVLAQFDVLGMSVLLK